MAKTTGWGIEYPVGTAVPNVPLDLKKLADSTDAALKKLVEDQEYHEQGGTWASTSFTPASGWKVLHQRFRQIQHYACGYLYLERTGASIANSSTGNVGNVKVGSLGLLHRPSVHLVGSMTTASIGRPINLGVDADGEVWLSAMGGTAALYKGETFNVQGTWITTND